MPKNRLMNEMMRTISLIVSDPIRQKMVKQKMDTVIAYGKKYDIFTDIDEKSFRLNCRGGKLSTVLEALKEKFIENWAVFDATISARSKAEGEILKIISEKEISDLDTSR